MISSFNNAPASRHFAWCLRVCEAQRVTDAHNAIPEFAIRKEAAEAVTVHERRIADLTRLKSEGGGFGLSEDAGTVIAERAKLERAVAERDRQQALYEVVAASLGQKLFWQHTGEPVKLDAFFGGKFSSTFSLMRRHMTRLAERLSRRITSMLPTSCI